MVCNSGNSEAMPEHMMSSLILELDLFSAFDNLSVKVGLAKVTLLHLFFCLFELMNTSPIMWANTRDK